MTENTFGGEGASEFYIKDQERLAKKRENRKQFIPEDELNQVVAITCTNESRPRINFKQQHDLSNF